MYAIELSINHVVAKYGLNIPETRKLDCQTSSEDNVNQCWMYSWNEERFSKQEMQAGKYANITLEELNISITRDYCMYMALDGNRTPPDQLRALSEKYI